MKKNKTPHILFVSPLPPPIGGIASWTKRIFDNGLLDHYQMDLVNTQAFNSTGILHRKKRWLEIKRTIYIVTALIKKICSNQIDCVHLNCSLSSVGIFRDFFILFFSRLFKIKVITHYHGNLPDFPGYKYWGFSEKCLSWLIKWSHTNIVLNNFSYAYIKTHSNRNCILLPNFIENNIIDTVNKNISVNQNNHIAIFVGSITKAKGWFEIINVARQLPDVQFWLLGEIKQDVVCLLKKIPSNIYLMGEQDSTIVIKKMCEANLLFFPSHTEGFPNAVLEAMAVGLPVVATRVGAIPEMIDHEQGGILVHIGDVNAMVEGIETILNNNYLQNKMGMHNKQKCKLLYSYSVVSRQLANLYEEIINKV